MEALSSTLFTGNRKAEIIAEAKLMRAYGHYNLLRYFCRFDDTESEYGALIRDEFVTTNNIAKSRAIGLMGIDMQDDGKELPTPTPISELTVENGVVTLVDIDFDVYRRKNELRAVKKNCTIPSWLNYEAEKANINFSQVLQNALMEQLKISR